MVYKPTDRKKETHANVPEHGYHLERLKQMYKMLSTITILAGIVISDIIPVFYIFLTLFTIPSDKNA